MIFAIPSRNGEPHNHFSKAEQIMVIDENTRQKTLVDIPETQSHCGRKKYSPIFSANIRSVPLSSGKLGIPCSNICLITSSKSLPVPAEKPQMN